MGEFSSSERKGLNKRNNIEPENTEHRGNSSSSPTH